jgi:hypothetical protein
MNTLDRYLLRSIVGAVLLVMAVFLTLGGLFLFIGQQDDIGVGRYTGVDALSFVLLNLPQQAWELMPISALIGTLVGLGALARGSELTVMRAAGLSVWRIARAALVAGLVLAAASGRCSARYWRRRCSSSRASRRRSASSTTSASPGAAAPGCATATCWSTSSASRATPSSAA